MSAVVSPSDLVFDVAGLFCVSLELTLLLVLKKDKTMHTFKSFHVAKHYEIPYKFYVLGQIGLSKQCRPSSDCF